MFILWYSQRERDAALEAAVGAVDTMNSRKSDLTVIIKTQELCSYILTVTEKSPKRFRFTLTSRLQNCALEALEQLYQANDIFIKAGEASAGQRLERQRQAMTKLKLLCYLAELAQQQGCILYKQFEQITMQSADCQNLLGAWMNSDRRRLRAGTSGD